MSGSDADIWGDLVWSDSEDSDAEAEAALSAGGLLAAPPLNDMTEPALEGLVAETIAWFIARKERGLGGELPAGVWAFVDGAPRLVGFDEEPRLLAAFAKILPLMLRVVKGLHKLGVCLRGARCWAYARRLGHRSVDLRVRMHGGRRGVAGHRALLELKWSRKSVRPAKRECRKHFDDLRTLAQRGQWRGPHPRSGKQCKGRYVGGVAVAGSGWHFQLWKVPAAPATALKKVDRHQARFRADIVAPPAPTPATGSAPRPGGAAGAATRPGGAAGAATPPAGETCIVCRIGSIRAARLQLEHTRGPFCFYVPRRTRSSSESEEPGRDSGMDVSESESDSNSC